ncbi:transmembrane protein 254 [Hypomesus transpacificus]|uniref:transmembrane protein 254 n=1 Tax=Hypomesus transpacificus TaxID=137520 RepID=UPI001F0819DE|nr:transmembrane protein 254 [Hypomesus transpacificus]
MAKSDGCDYFKRTSLFWIITVTLSMGYFTCVVFMPEHVPYDNLGPLGSLSKYLVHNHHELMVQGWWAAWAIHVFEALVAMRICRAKGIAGPTTRLLWFVQTILFGFASLGLLIKYKPDRLKHQ